MMIRINAGICRSIEYFFKLAATPTDQWDPLKLTSEVWRRHSSMPQSRTFTILLFGPMQWLLRVADRSVTATCRRRWLGLRTAAACTGQAGVCIVFPRDAEHFNESAVRTFIPSTSPLISHASIPIGVYASWMNHARAHPAAAAARLHITERARRTFATGARILSVQSHSQLHSWCVYYYHCRAEANVKIDWICTAHCKEETTESWRQQR